MRTFVFGLLGLNWVMASSVSEWVFVKKKVIYFLFHLLFFGWCRKKRNKRAFEGIKTNFTKIRDKWIHTFVFILLSHDIKN